MHIKKSTLMKCCLLLVIVVAVLACMHSLRELNYKAALSIMENYQYELAEEQFLAMDGYRDSEELATEMVRLTEFNQKQIQKLLPVPEFDAENQYEVTYVGATAVDATLYNVAGQAVVNASAQADNVVVDASSVASGVYILAVEANGAKYTTKVVVK